MRAMLNDGWSDWPYIINTDQDELDAMKEYWGDRYFDIPQELYERYETALDKLREITRAIENLAI